MKLHLVFSLNVTGSFVNDIFCVVRSIRYHQYGISLGKDVLEIISHLINMNDMIFLRFLAEKKFIIFCIIKHSATNTTFLAQIYFPEGTQPNSRGWGTITSSPYSVNSRRGGGSKVKVPSVGVWIFFLELHNSTCVQYFTDCFSVCGVLGDGFLQGSYGYTCICGSYFFISGNFYFSVSLATLPYPKRKEKQNVPEKYKKLTTTYT